MEGGPVHKEISMDEPGNHESNMENEKTVEEAQVENVTVENTEADKTVKSLIRYARGKFQKKLAKEDRFSPTQRGKQRADFLSDC